MGAAGVPFRLRESRKIAVQGEKIMGNRTIGINPYLVDYVPKDCCRNMPEGEVKVDCSWA